MKSFFKKSYCICKVMILYMILVIVTIFVLTSCNISSDPKFGSLSGRIIINTSIDEMSQPEDFGGITVALYNVAQIDTALVRINDRHPHIGIQVSQSSEFDHRDYDPVKITLTDPNGSFKISNIPFGTYNIVALMDGFGSKYVTSCEISEGTNHLSTFIGGAKEIKLYPDMKISGFVSSGSYLFSSKRQTVFDEDTVFLPETSAIVEPGAVIRIAAGKSLKFLGSVSLQGRADSLIVITTDNNYYSNSIVTTLPFYNVVIDNGANIINGIIGDCIIQKSKSGLYLNESARLVNSIIRAEENTLTMSGLNQQLYHYSVYNSILSTSSISSSIAIKASILNSLTIENCIMIDNNFALQVSGVGNCEIRNNYIKSKDICIKFMQEVTGLISSNEIESKNTAIYALISCDINIQENNIYAVTGILFRELYTNGNINGNNLFCDRYCIDYVTRDSGDMDAANNWWNTTNLDVIDAVINDKNDYLPSDTYYDAMSYVNYMPIRVGLNTNAGIK